MTGFVGIVSYAWVWVFIAEYDKIIKDSFRWHIFKFSIGIFEFYKPLFFFYPTETPLVFTKLQWDFPLDITSKASFEIHFKLPSQNSFIWQTLRRLFVDARENNQQALLYWRNQFPISRNFHAEKISILELFLFLFCSTPTIKAHRLVCVREYRKIMKCEKRRRKEFFVCFHNNKKSESENYFSSVLLREVQ